MASTPLRLATSFALLTASRVEFDVAPATIGTRPFTTSMVMSMTRSHSSWESVGVSPVVPQGTRKSILDSTCHSTNPRKDFSSIEPSDLNGVTSAVPHPRNFNISTSLSSETKQSQSQNQKTKSKAADKSVRPTQPKSSISVPAKCL